MSSETTTGIAGGRRSIAWRFTLAFGAIILALGLVSTACIWALIDTHRRLHEVKQDEQKARTVIQFASSVRDQYALVARTIILADDSHVSQVREASRRLTQLAHLVHRQAGLAEAKD